MVGGVLGPCLGGLYTRDGASKWGALHPSRLSMRLSHGPGLWIYSGHQYRHVRTTLAGHIRAAARPRHVRPDDTTTHTPLHSPLHSAFQHRISAGLRSPDEYNPPANKQNRHYFISNGFPSTLTCRRPENRSIQTRRKMTYSYGKWEQGGP